MPLVPLRRPAPIIRNVIEEQRRVQKHQDDNIDRINQRFSITEEIELDHGVETSITSPFAGTGLTVKAIEAVYCLGVNTTTGATYTTLGVPRIDWQPSSTSDDIVLVTATYPAPAGELRLIRTTALGIVDSTLTAVTWPTISTQTGSAFSFTAGGSNITCNRDGTIQVNAAVAYASNATGRRLAWAQTGTLALAGRAPAGETTPNASTFPSANAAGTLVVAAGDLLKVGAYQTSGGSLDTSDPTYCHVRYVAAGGNARGRLTLKFLGG